MKPISELKGDAFLRLLLQGEPGSGKTTLACGLPGAVVIDLDGNLAGPVNYRRAHNLTIPIGYYRVDREDDGTEIVVKDASKKEDRDKTMVKQFARLDKCLQECQENSECQTIVIDSATKLADMMFAETKGKNPTVKDGRQHYSFFLQDAKALMATLTRMRKNVVLTAHERVEYDEMTTAVNKDGQVTSGTKQYKVVWPGQFGDYIQAFFTNVWRCEVKDMGYGKPPARVVRTMTDSARHPGLKNDYELPIVWDFDWNVIAEKLK